MGASPFSHATFCFLDQGGGMNIVLHNAQQFMKLLDYRRDEGAFYWRVSVGRVSAGTRAGNYSGAHVSVQVMGRRYFVHRLVWLFEHGEWPAQEIDHINGDPHDNRVENLRDMPRRVNQQNRRVAQRNNKLGVLGVHEHKGRFRAFIKVDGKTKVVGQFDTLREANDAYLNAKRLIHEGCTL